MINCTIRTFSRILPGLYLWVRATPQNPIHKLRNGFYSGSSLRLMSHINASLLAHSEGPKASAEKVRFTFILSSGEQVEVEGNVGDRIMDIATKNELGMEGACEGSLACTTCHVYVDEKAESIFPPPSPKEEDLLDTAPFLKPNSRLSCQLLVSKELNGVCFKLPPGTMNMAVDGFKPKKH